MIELLKYGQRVLFGPILLIALVACGGSGDGTAAGATAKSDSRAVPVQLAPAKRKEVLVELYSVGRLVSRNTPSLAAEIDARVVGVLVEVSVHSRAMAQVRYQE